MFNEYSKQCKSKYISQCETFKMCDQYILIFVKKNINVMQCLILNSIGFNKQGAQRTKIIITSWMKIDTYRLPIIVIVC